MKKSINQFIKDILPVIAGILIALFINNWNEDRKDKKYIDKIFSSIKKELNETDQEITSKIAIQKSFIDTVKFHLNNDKMSLMEVTRRGNGIYSPFVRINSWKAISNSKIELLNYEKVTTLSNIEELRDLLRIKSEYITDFLFSKPNSTEKSDKELLIAFVREQIQTENDIQKEIKKIMEE